MSIAVGTYLDSKELMILNLYPRSLFEEQTEAIPPPKDLTFEK